MAKQKKVLSEEQKQVLRERLAKARAAKQAKIEQDVPLPGQIDLEEALEAKQEAEQTTITGDQDLNVVLARALEAIETLAKLQQGQGGGTDPSQPQFNGRKLVGQVQRYALDPNLYPSPVERLKNEPKLARFAFPINYDLTYEISSTSYESKDGINYIEPKFTFELHRIQMDPETGEPTGGRIVIKRLIMHEDPQTAIIVARDNGLSLDNEDEQAFLNEMRYIQARDWLLEVFYPPVNFNTRKNKREMVVDGKLVEYFELSSQDSQRIPFNELENKLQV